MLETMRYHRTSIFALVAFTVALISLVHPFGAPNYAYATVVEKERPMAIPTPSGSRSRPTFWRLNILGETPTIRATTLINRVAPGDVICVIYTDYWPEGLKVMQQVSLDTCTEENATE